MKENPAIEVIGLAGHMGAGKDVVARMLLRHGYRRIAFADALREEVQTAIRLQLIPAGIPAELAGIMKHIDHTEVWQKPTSPSMRKLLQWWGTEYRRGQNIRYWVDQVEETIVTLGGKWVVSDVRFPDEADLIHRHGGKVWRVDRDCLVYGIPNHVSEAVERIPYDLLIENNSSLDHLSLMVDAALA